MAQQTFVQLVDDLDPTGETDAHQTVPFMYQGVEYEIDLSDANAERLRKALAEYIDKARRTGGRKRRSDAPAASAVAGKPKASPEAPLIRAWAIEQGYPLTGRGRIPDDVVEAYHQAKAAEKAAEKAAPDKPARARRKPPAKRARK